VDLVADALARSAHFQRAAVHALYVARETAARVPAYARFLRLAGFDPRRLRGPDDFAQLPFTDAASYLARFAVAERCREGGLARAQAVAFGAGGAASPLLWPRFPEHDRALLQACGALLHEHFRLRERWTLLLLAAPVGTWIGGLPLAELAPRLFADQEARGTVIIPGLAGAEALHGVRQLGRHYDQVVLAGAPATLAELLDAGARSGIDWPALHTGLLLLGEDAPETERARLLERIGRPPDGLQGLCGLYSSLEAGGIVGYETPLCRLIRRLCARDPALARALFGSTRLPLLVQYDPFRHFLEVHADTLVLTTRGGMPLVRYRTAERGGLLRFEEVVARCQALGIDLAAELRARGLVGLRPLPFVYTYGRADAVSVRGALVSAAQLRAILERPSLRLALSGRFQVQVALASDGRTVLRVACELRPGVPPREELRRLYRYTVLRELQRRNPEFCAVYTAAAGRVELDLVLVTHARAEVATASAPPAAWASRAGEAAGR
jgi:phenylacetate-CoA ligase